MTAPVRVSVAFACYVAGAIVLGALASPIVYLGLGAMGITDVAFEKLNVRCIQLMALFGLWPLLTVMGLRLRDGLGFRRKPRSRVAHAHFPAELFRGVCWGVVSLALVAVVLLVFGVRSLRPDRLNLAYWLVVMLKAALTASAVAIVEEIWFRGALHSAFQRGFGVLGAIVITAVLYAGVHFIRADVSIDLSQAGWLAGFEAAIGSIGRFSRASIAPDFAALFVAGVWLGILRHRSGRIALCIGVHAGWVFVIQILRRVTDFEPTSHWAFLTGNFDHVIGWLAALVFVASMAVMVWAERKENLSQSSLSEGASS